MHWKNKREREREGGVKREGERERGGKRGEREGEREGKRGGERGGREEKKTNLFFSCK